MERIASLKPYIIEPKESIDLQDSMETHTENIQKSGGSIFFAVCRGKVSEGLDFSDHNGRAVIIVGIPYPSAVDIKVKLKKEFLDKQVNRKGKKVSILYYIIN